ncbi:MAG TPA: TIM-barrel domain-containing protein [Chthoniobacteraceae bacterium]|jgi:alpha-D-xyloside xylohydrolase|nr:TIM-barrel domain-containing protein [Chthoniobacteraceae bacterium]
MTKRFIGFCFLLAFGMPLLLLSAPLRASEPQVIIDAGRKSVSLIGGHLSLRITPWSAGAIRVEAVPGPQFPQKRSFAVIASPDSAGWTVSRSGGAVTLSGPRLSASLDERTGLVQFLDKSGHVLLAQRAWNFKPAANPSRDGLDIQALFARNAGEHLYGGGVIGADLRHPQADIALENDYLQMHIPILYSSNGYGFFWDNSSRGKLRTTPDSVSWESSAGDEADYYVMVGPGADSVIGEYRLLTGQAPLFPRWAYGFWFSRNAFRSQAEILSAAAHFRKDQLPIDLLIQDYYYWAPNHPSYPDQNWGSHHFDPVRYPDPAAMIKQLHDEDHLHFMAVVWPKFDPATAHARELDQAGGLYPSFNNSGLRFYDPFNPHARQIYGRQVMESLYSLGVDAFWMDAAEPEMPFDKYAAFDTAAGPASRVMDAFPLMHTTSVYTAQRSITSDKRVVLLPRSAWAGEQRNGACSWTSDIRQDWKTLAWQIEGLQNYCVCGLPYVTTDVGGYNPTPQSDRELFVRWFEWGAFCPIFRVHGIARPYPWDYGKLGEDIFRKFDTLRYRLLPYTYTEASRVTMDAGTLMRPLVMDFRNDPRALTQWDEFMYGPSLLICPVYQSSREDAGLPGQFSDHDGSPHSVTASYIRQSGTNTVHEELNDGLVFKDEGAGKQDGPVRAVSVEGTYTPAGDGPLAFEISEPHPAIHPVTMVIDGHAVPSTPYDGDWHFPQFPFVAKSGVPVKFSFETTMSRPAFRVVRNLPLPLHRDVYLPGSGAWYDFWTGDRLAGGETRAVPAPLDMIPIYVRAGAIIPLGAPVQYAAESPNGPIELRVYPGADGSFSLYQDAGDTYAYEKGEYAEIPISWNEARKELTFGARKGGFPAMPAGCTFNIVWVGPNHGVGETTTEKPDSTVTYTGQPMSVRMH